MTTTDDSNARLEEHAYSVLIWAKKEKDRLRKALAEVEEHEALARNRIQTAMDQSETFVLNGRPVVTWKHGTTHRLDQKLLKTRYPQVHEDCYITVEARKFVVLDGE